MNFLGESDPPKCAVINSMEPYATYEVTLWSILPAYAERILSMKKSRLQITLCSKSPVLFKTICETHMLASLATKMMTVFISGVRETFFLIRVILLNVLFVGCSTMHTCSLCEEMVERALYPFSERLELFFSPSSPLAPERAADLCHKPPSHCLGHQRSPANLPAS